MGHSGSGLSRCLWDKRDLVSTPKVRRCFETPKGKEMDNTAFSQYPPLPHPGSEESFCPSTLPYLWTQPLGSTQGRATKNQVHTVMTAWFWRMGRKAVSGHVSWVNDKPLWASVFSISHSSVLPTSTVRYLSVKSLSVSQVSMSEVRIRAPVSQVL